MEFILVLAMCCGIGMFAKSKGRSAWGWGIGSMFISPLLAGIILALLKDKTQEQSISKIDMEQQQLKERIAINEVQVNQRFQQVENRLNSNTATTMTVETQNSDSVLLSDGNIHCPYCGEIIKQSAIKCRFCGMDIKPIKMKECPYCKEMIKENATVCKFCHSKLEFDNIIPDSLEVTHDTHRCPSCHVDLSDDSKFCPNCGCKL